MVMRPEPGVEEDASTKRVVLLLSSCRNRQYEIRLGHDNRSGEPETTTARCGIRFVGGTGRGSGSSSRSYDGRSDGAGRQSTGKRAVAGVAAAAEWKILI